MKVEDYKWNIQPQDYGVLARYVYMDSITDVDFNGKALWVSCLLKGRYCVEDTLEPLFVEQFCNRIANLISRPFNKNNPVIEAETTDLRITIVHSCVALTGTTICIRKTPVKMRLSEQVILDSGYSSKGIMNLLGNCVKAGLSIAVCGAMGCGKTELVKYLTKYIPDHEKAITLEDTMEVHYREVNPGKDCVALKVDKRFFSYEAALKTSLRLNAEWMILSEARSTEVKYLMENMSIGTGCLTTLHADDVRKIPDRIKNMYPDTSVSERIENDVYAFLNVGVMLRRKQLKNEKVRRYIHQVCFFTRENNSNQITMIAEDQEIINYDIPLPIKKKMYYKEIQNPFEEEADL